MSYSAYPTESIQVAKLVVQATGTYNQQFRRPYQSIFDRDVVNSVANKLEQHRKLVASDFIAGSDGQSFIQQTAAPESRIEIANGFSTPRLRFMLQLVARDRMGTETSYFFTGYTEYGDLSLQSHMIDPQMRFFINSRTETRQMRRTTAIGTYVQNQVMNSDNVLIQRNYTANEGLFGSDKIYAMTPDKIFANLENEGLRMGANPGDMFFDTRLNLSGKPEFAKRRNSIAPAYAADLLNTYAQVSASEAGQDVNSTLITCQNHIRAEETSVDPFFQFLMRRRQSEYGSFTVAYDNSFSLGDLDALDPNTRNVLQVIPFVEGQHAAGLTAAWDASDRVTLMASTLAQALPGYMTQYFFGFVHLVSTNHTIGAQIQTNVVDVNGFNASHDMRGEVQAFIHQIENELLRPLTFNNQLSFSLEMRVDTMGETWIQIQLDVEPAVMYVAPTFCDALAMPVVTLDQNKLQGITDDVSKFTEVFHERNLVAGHSSIMQNTDGGYAQAAAAPMTTPGGDWSLSGNTRI